MRGEKRALYAANPEMLAKGLPRERFRRRFGEMEAAARESGRPLERMNAEELDHMWEAAKDPG